MGLIVLTFVACLHGGSRCSTIQIPLQGENLFVCMQGGQIEMARWFNEHPNYTLNGHYKCELSGRDT